MRWGLRALIPAHKFKLPLVLACSAAGASWAAGRTAVLCEASTTHTEELDSHVHQALMDRLWRSFCMQIGSHCDAAGKSWWSFLVELFHVMRRALRLAILVAPV